MPDRKLRLWWTIATAGCVVVTLVLIVIALVVVDKKHFGDLVGPRFLPIVMSTICLGALAVLVAAWQLRRTNNRHWVTLAIWSLIALTSPAFGLMFLLPWVVLAISLPLVVYALLRLR